MDFFLDVVNDHKTSTMYKNAVDGYNYANGHNTLIENYQKVLYTLQGQAVPDNYSANHKLKSGFYKRFVTQRAAFLLGNGVTFSNETVKTKLGENFDKNLYFAGRKSISEAVIFGFWNYDHIDYFSAREFAPLFDAENGALAAGVRFWQLADGKPLRLTVFEMDGVTEYIKRPDEDMQIMTLKRSYKLNYATSAASGTVIYDGGNYESFPIVPWFSTESKEPLLVGIKEQIDCYDLIKSGFASDIDDASMIYWTISNAGGMDDIDLAKFIERMKTVKATTVDDEVNAEAHTLDVPSQSREMYLAMLKKDLYEDAMALDVTQIAAGNVTATQINAAYEPLNEAADEFEFYTLEFLNGIFKLAGITNEKPTFNRSIMKNQEEETQKIISQAPFFDAEYIRSKLLALNGDIDLMEEITERINAAEIEQMRMMGAE